MADNPSSTPDDGVVGLPKIDSAMNKLPPPRSKKGGRGAENDGKTARLGSRQKELDKVRMRAIKRLDRAIEAEAANRKDALDDLKFKAGDQWPADIQAQRRTDNRPCLTVNKLPTFIHQITNDLRQNRPGIVINPVGDKVHPEVAKMYAGWIRAVQRDSHADIAYDTGSESAVSMGWGYWRIITRFEEPDSFNQVARVVRVRNPFTVYLDPERQEPDGHDAKWGFITSLIPKEEFESLYPDADMVAFNDAGIGEKLANWVTGESIRIAEYFEVSQTTRKLVGLDNGHVGWEDELDDDVMAMIKSGDLTVERERESKERKVHWYKLNALEVIDDKPWPGTEGVPIVQVIGDEIDIEGKVKLSGVVRNAKDPQRMFNYWRTLETELIALQPKAPYIGVEGQFEDPKWKTANTGSFPYLEYAAVDLSGHPAPPPQRQPFAGAPAGVEAAIQGAAQDMMATTGIRFDATQNERMIDESGRAIRELRRSGDLGSFHYVDNMARSLRRTGHILLDLFDKLHDTKRMITVVREDDSEEQVLIDPDASKPMQEVQGPDGKKLKIFNPRMGRYGVTVTIGPSYATKRIEASESMMAFAKAMPATAMLIADLIAKNQDWDGADEMARRLAKAVPPQLMTPDQKDIPPQVQAVMQAMDQQIKQLSGELQKAMMALTEKQSERAIEIDKINKDFEAKLLAIVQKAEQASAAVGQKADAAALAHVGHEGSQLKDMAQGVTMLMKLLKGDEEDPAMTALGEKVDKSHQELTGKIAESHKTMQQTMTELTKLMKAPKRVKVKRGEDGMVQEMVTEHGE